MKVYLQNILKSIGSFSQTLDQRSLIIDKPWSLIDNDSEVQKLIFKKDKELVLSKNGNVQIGSWEHLPEARSILIDRKTDKILLNEVYVDEAVIILKKDGTDHEFFTLVNQNLIPSLNPIDHLENIRRKKLRLAAIELADGRTIDLHVTNIDYPVTLGSRVSFQDENLEDGQYRLLSKNKFLNIQDSIVRGFLKEFKTSNSEGQVFRILQKESRPTRGDIVLIGVNGDVPADGTYSIARKRKIEVKDGTIVKIWRLNGIWGAFTDLIKGY